MAEIDRKKPTINVQLVCQENRGKEKLTFCLFCESSVLMISVFSFTMRQPADTASSNSTCQQSHCFTKHTLSQ